MTTFFISRISSGLRFSNLLFDSLILFQKMGGGYLSFVPLYSPLPFAAFSFCQEPLHLTVEYMSVFLEVSFPPLHWAFKLRSLSLMGTFVPFSALRPPCVVVLPLSQSHPRCLASHQILIGGPGSCIS